MNWKYFEPKFEYEKRFHDTAWPWAGHKFFAYDLVSNMKPGRIVELGTHYGTSLWSFAQAVKDNKIETELNAIDTWEGEKHAGFYSEEVFETVNGIKDKFYTNLKINLIRKTFDEALSGFEDKSIDVLHIDGLHTYDAVKHDFESWLPKIKENGLILFHDIKVCEGDFGVYKFWDELKSEYSTIEFHQSFGLGVLFMDNENEYIARLQKELQMHYYFLHEKVKNEKINASLGVIEQKEHEIMRLNSDLQQKNLEINKKEQEINLIKSSKFWKLRMKYMAIKKKFLGN